WDANTGSELLTLKGHTASVRALAYSPDGATLASGGGGDTVRLWDAATGQGRGGGGRAPGAGRGRGGRPRGGTPPRFRPGAGGPAVGPGPRRGAGGNVRGPHGRGDGAGVLAAGRVPGHRRHGRILPGVVEGGPAARRPPRPRRRRDRAELRPRRVGPRHLRP